MKKGRFLLWYQENGSCQKKKISLEIIFDIWKCNNLTPLVGFFPPLFEAADILNPTETTRFEVWDPSWPQMHHCTAPPLLNGHVGPVEAAPGQQHVPYQSFYGGFAHQADEEKLLYDRR